MARVLVATGSPGMAPKVKSVVIPSRRLTVEQTVPCASAKELMANPQWRAWYEKTMPLTESGYREIFNVVE